MSQTPRPDEIRARILDLVDKSGQLPRDVPPSFDLLLEGLIDSFGVIEIVTQLEADYGVVFDFDELEADELTQIGPLSEYVAKKAAG